MARLAPGGTVDQPAFVEIDVETLDRMRQDGEPLLVVDVREPWEVETCSFDDGVAIPMGDFLERVEELPHDRTLVVVCHHGIRSAQVAAWMRQNGFENAVNLAGGIDDWARRIDPTMKTY